MKFIYAKAALVALSTLAASGMANAATVPETISGDLQRNVTESSSARLFAEQSGVTVGAGDVTVDYLASGLTLGASNAGFNTPGVGIALGAGTYDSFLIHFDPFSAASTSGSFSFLGNIVAIILSNGSNGNNQGSGFLNMSDATFGIGTTSYENHYGRRTESNDSFTLVSATELSYNLAANSKHIDNIRVITEVAPVPLPASAMLLLAGLGGLSVVRRRKS